MTSLARPVAATAALVAALVAAPMPAHADVGVGLFVGEPLGVTVKVGLERRTALEVLVGWDDWDDDRGRDGYGHLTFLVSPFVARGRSVLIPFRLGIGGALFDAGDDVGVAARAPFQLAFMFRKAPLELYLEVALKLVIVPDDDVDVDGGLGFRVYF